MNDWSTFEEDVKSNARPRGPRCSVGVMLDDLPPFGQVAVKGVLANSTFSIPAIARALKVYVPEKALPSPWSLANHRRGKCGCAR